MKVKEILSYLGIENNNESEVSKIVTSTKDVIDGCILLCINGNTINPYNLIDKQIEKKCSAIITDTPNNKYFYYKDLKEKCFDILYYFNFPKGHNFKIIGITGTEGKSSLAQILFQGLKLQKKKTMLITTELYGNDYYHTNLTTPSSSELIEIMLKAENQKMKYLIMEISSISICEKRINPKIFDYLFLTSLERDHLDYHKNIYHYHMSKLSLFLNNKKAKKYISKEVYDKYPHIFNRTTNLTIIDMTSIKLKNNSLTHQVFTYKNINYYTHLIFKKNRENIIYLIEFFINNNFNNIYEIIKKIKRIKGRLDLVNSRPYIIIDYAHTTKALELLLMQTISFKQNKLILVFGAGGDRDSSKRIDYGKLAYKYCDHIIVTNDNPRKEDPLKIANEIIGNHQDKFEVILNRKKAIESAIINANRDDIVLIVGRGNEEYQKIGNKTISLNDYEVVKRCLFTVK